MEPDFLKSILDMVKKRFGQFFAIIAADNNPLFSLKVKILP